MSLHPTREASSSVYISPLPSINARTLTQSNRSITLAHRGCLRGCYPSLLPRLSKHNSVILTLLKNLRRFPEIPANDHLFRRRISSRSEYKSHSPFLRFLNVVLANNLFVPAACYAALGSAFVAQSRSDSPLLRFFPNSVHVFRRSKLCRSTSPRSTARLKSRSRLRLSASK